MSLCREVGGAGTMCSKTAGVIVQYWTSQREVTGQRSGENRVVMQK